MLVKGILLKFTSMFLTDFFYYSKVILSTIKRNTRYPHFRILINKFYYTYFKIYRCLANFKFSDCVYKFAISYKFYRYFTLLVGYHQNNVFFLFFLVFILLIHLTASSGFLTFSANFSIPFSANFSVRSLSVCSLNTDSHNFSKIFFLPTLSFLLVSSYSKN